MWLKVRCYKPSVATLSACLIGTKWQLTEIKCLSNCLQPNFLLPNQTASAFLCLQELNLSLTAGFCRSQVGRISFSAGSWNSPKVLGVIHRQGSIPKASTSVSQEDPILLLFQTIQSGEPFVSLDTLLSSVTLLGFKHARFWDAGTLQACAWPLRYRGGSTGTCNWVAKDAGGRS